MRAALGSALDAAPEPIAVLHVHEGAMAKDSVATSLESRSGTRPQRTAKAGGSKRGRSLPPLSKLKDVKTAVVDGELTLSPNPPPPPPPPPSPPRASDSKDRTKIVSRRARLPGRRSGTRNPNVADESVRRQYATHQETLQIRQSIAELRKCVEELRGSIDSTARTTTATVVSTITSTRAIQCAHAEFRQLVAGREQP